MLYAIFGTHQEQRKKAQEELASLGTVTNHLYSEHVLSLEPLINATTIFNEPIVALLVQTFDSASSKEVVTKLLGDMKESRNIFILDEPFADAYKIKAISKHAVKVFDAREEKKKEIDIFRICNLIGKRDKKEAWIEWMHIRDKDSAEALQGIIWWKWKTIWADTLEGKPSKFTKQECELIGEKLMKSTILAHRGKGDIKATLEEIILAL